MGSDATRTGSLYAPGTRNGDYVALTTSAGGGSVTGESVVGNGTTALELTQIIIGFRSRIETGATAVNYVT